MQTYPSYDIICVGLGLVGKFLAIGLARAGFKIAIVEKSMVDLTSQHDSDIRAISIALGSQKLFAEWEIWQHLQDLAQPILRVQVVENQSPWMIDYQSQDVSSQPMGFIVEKAAILSSMNNVIHSYIGCGIDLYDNDTIESVQHTTNDVCLTTAKGKALKSSLVIGVDGRFSRVRQLLGIPATTTDYNQNAFVSTITHTTNHHGCAYEVFHNEGPMALLPMLRPHTQREDNLFQSGIVWCAHETFDFKNIAREKKEEILSKEFPFLGSIHLAETAEIYPLSQMTVPTLIADRAVLVGDSAHVLHPVAGQGVNLGWRDAKTLVDTLVSQRNIGGDIGCPIMLNLYERSRKFDQHSLLLFTDKINSLFASRRLSLKILRNAGFMMMNYSPPLKRFFMRQAMGIRL